MRFFKRLFSGKAGRLLMLIATVIIVLWLIRNLGILR